MQRIAQTFTPVKASQTVTSCNQKAKSSPTLNRRHAGVSLVAGALIALSSAPRSAQALGLESIPLPSPGESPAFVQEWEARNRATLDAAESTFQESELLKTLKAKSDAMRSQRDKELRAKYCMRQAEMGVGDCAGLQLIPGATKNGVQKRPEWLDKLVYGDSPPPQ